MGEYKQRVINEYDDLAIKIGLLTSFTKSASFKHIAEQDLLMLQLDAMKAYAEILKMRTELF